MLVFGSGLHRCLGESLAMLEATLMLALMLRYFNWQVVNGQDSLKNLEQNLTVFPEDKMPIRFTSLEELLGDEPYNTSSQDNPGRVDLESENSDRCQHR